MQAERSLRRATLIEEPDSPAAWRRVAAMAAEDDLICVTGSFFLAGELRGLVAQQPLRVPRGAEADRGAPVA
jgi:folylpolyglutamate synthase/dihydropteroate synthase